MATFETVRVAAIQATPVILDADATVGKAIDLLNTAADEGVQLAVLPETFVSLYPSGSWAYAAARFSGYDKLWERMWASSLDVPGPLVDRIAAVCGERGIWCVVGVNERESERPGSLYNTMLTIGPLGRVGGLICWENRMPLARYALYKQGPQIGVAPTADDADGWLASMRHIAIESGAYVVSVPQYIP